jgi:2-succinyl-5-enolpyruvyl-6-hydroxy-3-cyclohexene-1-carboxylate synthase
VFKDYFATPHEFSFAGAAETFRLDYYSADTKEGFVEAYAAALGKGRSAVIEVCTDREHNLGLRRGIKKEIIDLLNGSV